MAAILRRMDLNSQNTPATGKKSASLSATFPSEKIWKSHNKGSKIEAAAGILEPVTSCQKPLLSLHSASPDAKLKENFH